MGKFFIFLGIVGIFCNVYWLDNPAIIAWGAIAPSLGDAIVFLVLSLWFLVVTIKIIKTELLFCRKPFYNYLLATLSLAVLWTMPALILLAATSFLTGLWARKKRDE